MIVKRIKVHLHILLAIYTMDVHSSNLLPLEKVMEESIFNTARVRQSLLSLEKSQLEHRIYKKSLLPSLSLEMTPVAFRHSMRLMQSYYTGEYNNIEEYSNAANGKLVFSQYVKATGGTLLLGSGLSVLQEFSSKVSNFSSEPFYVKYTQELFGGRKKQRLQDKIASLKRKAALMQCCESVSIEQQRLLGLYMNAVISGSDRDFYLQVVRTDSILVSHALKRKALGKLTDYECQELELQELNDRASLARSSLETRSLVRQLEEELCACEIEVMAPDSHVLPPSILTEEAIELVRKNSCVASTYALEKTNQSLELHEVRQRNRFNASLGLMYGLNQYGKRLSASYSHPNQQQSISMTLSIPVFQFGIGNDRIRLAESELKRVILEHETAIEDNCRQVMKLVTEYNSSVRNVALDHQKFLVASSFCDKAITLFKTGKCTVTEVSRSHQMLLQARRDLFHSISEQFACYYRIRHLTMYDFMARKSLVDILSEKLNNETRKT